MCFKGFHDRIRLEMPQFKASQEDKMYQCDLCVKVFNDAKILEKPRFKKSLECDLCGKIVMK